MFKPQTLEDLNQNILAFQLYGGPINHNNRKQMAQAEAYYRFIKTAGSYGDDVVDVQIVEESQRLLHEMESIHRKQWLCMLKFEAVKAAYEAFSPDGYENLQQVVDAQPDRTKQIMKLFNDVRKAYDKFERLNDDKQHIIHRLRYLARTAESQW